MPFQPIRMSSRHCTYLVRIPQGPWTSIKMSLATASLLRQPLQTQAASRQRASLRDTRHLIVECLIEIDSSMPSHTKKDPDEMGLYHIGSVCSSKFQFKKILALYACELVHYHISVVLLCSFTLSLVDRARLRGPSSLFKSLIHTWLTMECSAGRFCVKSTIETQ